MGQAPSTLLQLAIIVSFVLPGIVYQYVREIRLGPKPGERDIGERVLRALTASIVLNALYLTVAGPSPVKWLFGEKPAWGRDLILNNLRQIGLFALLFFVIVPAIAAVGTAWLIRRRQPARYDAVPTAWDSAFVRRSPCFVRARLKDGLWIGGWYGSESYASGFPHQADLFLQSAWQLDGSGHFEKKTEATGGMLIQASSIAMLEFLEVEDGAK
ncbi:DUF6338 family protein [Kribbella sp. NBC_00482]|uniref:DUF6338 family protein n=1 Tax=Kribbella sp. NBC_00482 TaxID=2975968 RepID=UPI002E16D02B